MTCPGDSPAGLGAQQTAPSVPEPAQQGSPAAQSKGTSPAANGAVHAGVKEEDGDSTPAGEQQPAGATADAVDATKEEPADGASPSEVKAEAAGAEKRPGKPGQHLLKHEVTPEIRAAAVAALGQDPLEAGQHIWELRQAAAAAGQPVVEFDLTRQGCNGVTWSVPAGWGPAVPPLPCTHTCAWPAPARPQAAGAAPDVQPRVWGADSQRQQRVDAGQAAARCGGALDPLARRIAAAACRSSVDVARCRCTRPRYVVTA
jgi:hypothetical protein